ncbi:MAG TPA: hypothetical protein VFU05_17080 [Cyclobacteriaceae bacterium]|nr:hypothetical protein [Cyclobacteriaceae bacterium]
MGQADHSQFLVAWHNAMILGAIFMVAIGILVYLFHNLRVSLIDDFHLKYNYINSKEIRNYKLVYYCFGVAAMLLINLYQMDKMKEVEVWFFVRFFMGLAGGTLVGYVAHLILEYYYPTRLDKKLKKWRFMPRINPANGSKMRLLSEEEEDVHLQEGMIAEENVFSIDYDVWIDEKTGDVLIEKYEGRLQALKCNSCGFYTMRIIKEEVTKQPTAEEPGELVKSYQCSYCKSVRATAFNISTKETEDYKKEKFKFRRNKDVELVKLEIISVSGDKKHFEFQNTDQAQKFLSEFDYEKS